MVSQLIFQLVHFRLHHDIARVAGIRPDRGDTVRVVHDDISCYNPSENHQRVFKVGIIFRHHSVLPTCHSAILDNLLIVLISLHFSSCSLLGCFRNLRVIAVPDSQRCISYMGVGVENHVRPLDQHSVKTESLNILHNKDEWPIDIGSDFPPQLVFPETGLIEGKHHLLVLFHLMMDHFHFGYFEHLHFLHHLVRVERIYWLWTTFNYDRSAFGWMNLVKSGKENA